MCFLYICSLLFHFMLVFPICFYILHVLVFVLLSYNGILLFFSFALYCILECICILYYCILYIFLLYIY